jgi:hypothetical protein
VALRRHAVDGRDAGGHLLGTSDGGQGSEVKGRWPGRGRPSARHLRRRTGLGGKGQVAGTREAPGQSNNILHSTARATMVACANVRDARTRLQ